MLQTTLNIAVFLVTVLLLVTVHEYGHFWVARRLGIPVLKFSIGFGKPLVRWQGASGTEYAIAWIPLGGYVKLLDEREAPVPESQKPFAFNRQSLLKRTMVVAAGPGINLLFAVLAFWSVWMIGLERVKPVIGEVIPGSIAEASGMQAGETIILVDRRMVDSWGQVGLGLIRRLGESGGLVIGAAESKTPSNMHAYNLSLADWQVDALKPDLLKSLGIIPYRPPVPPIIDSVMPDTPADISGLKPGDRILELNGVAVKDWSEVGEYIHTHPQQKMHFTVLRDGQTLSIEAMSDRRLAGFHWVGYVGIKPVAPTWPEGMREIVQLPLLQAFNRALQDTWDYTAFHFIVLQKMVVGEVSLSSLGGPISIYQVTSRSFHEGLAVYIAFLGLISVMLACVNILPIPGLDGGHLLFFAIEAVTRRPVSVRVQALFFRLGFILLAVLIFHAMANDLMRL